MRITSISARVLAGMMAVGSVVAFAGTYQWSGGDGHSLQLHVGDGIVLRDFGHMTFRNFTVKSISAQSLFPTAAR
ncbi:MAG: hypothetical protein IJI36_16895 [Kiritimatiellae bacterium]|nr:hypothetical protein [Kiritimatiellia bacterium]